MQIFALAITVALVLVTGMVLVWLGLFLRLDSRCSHLVVDSTIAIYALADATQVSP